MYILKNSLMSIIRSKGRNILIGIIILVISAACTVTLAIRNTANNLVANYRESTDLIATLSFDRNSLTQEFKGGEEAQRENIETFNNIESFKVSDIENYGNSQYLKSFYYLYTTSLNSDTITKATDQIEYEVEDAQTTTSTTTSVSGNNQGGKGGNGGMSYHTNTNTTTVITKSKEIFQNSRNLTGDFQINGYSSYDAMTEFVNGTYQITEGSMISTLDDFECVVNSELATLNEITVGSTITLKNPNTGTTYDFVVAGIFLDNSNTDDTSNMYSKTANTIITGSKVVEQLVSEDESLVTNVTPTFILTGEESIDGFTEEVKEKGLGAYYTITTNLDEIKNATKSIENVETFATTFLIITLVIAAVVLFVINMINIRERKYEIGVYRTIGVSKFKLTMQFVLELLIISIIFLAIGAGLGALVSKDIGNMLLQNEIEETKAAQEEVSNNFGGKNFGDNSKFNGMIEVKAIDSMDAVVNYEVILQLLGIGIILTLCSSLASMISIQKFSPLTILKERS